MSGHKVFFAILGAIVLSLFFLLVVGRYESYSPRKEDAEFCHSDPPISFSYDPQRGAPRLSSYEDRHGHPPKRGQEWEIKFPKDNRDDRDEMIFIETIDFYPGDSGPGICFDCITFDGKEEEFLDFLFAFALDKTVDSISYTRIDSHEALRLLVVGVKNKYSRELNRYVDGELANEIRYYIPNVLGKYNVEIRRQDGGESIVERIATTIRFGVDCEVAR